MATLAAGSSISFFVNWGQSIRIQTQNNVFGKIRFIPQNPESPPKNISRSFGPLATDQTFGPWDTAGTVFIDNDSLSQASINYTSLAWVPGVTVAQPIQASVDPVSGRSDNTTWIKQSRRPVHVWKNTSGTITTSATPFSNTENTLISCPVEFNAVRIGIIHGGGSGATIGTALLVAGTDDIGTRDYSVLSGTTTNKNSVSPKRLGTTYNALAASKGAPGWQQVTFAGSATIAQPDAGAGKQNVSWSDIIPVASFKDANNLWPLIVRQYFGTGPMSRISLLGGFSTGTNYSTDVLGEYHYSLEKAGDQVTTPSTWTDALTPGASAVEIPMVVEFYCSSINDSISVCFVGDSRSAISTELAGTKDYLSMARLYQTIAYNSGKKVQASMFAESGKQPSDYAQWFLNAAASGDFSADYLVYTVWSVNQNSGAMTDADVAESKYWASMVIDRCFALGITPILIPAWPLAGAGNATQKTNYANLLAWCQGKGKVLNLMTKYADANLQFLPAYQYAGGNHMNQAGYSLVAADLNSIIV